MEKKTFFWIAGALVIVIVLVVVASQKESVSEKNGKEMSATSSSEPMFNGVPLKEVYTSEVPQHATLTQAQVVVPASENASLGTVARTIVLKASRDGFDPSTITVNQWDRLELLFSPQDGEYDFSIPYLGSHFFAVKKGEQKSFVFELPASGTFTFECLDACPPSGTIKGQIVVLPKSLR